MTATHRLPCNDPVVGRLHQLPLLNHVHALHFLSQVCQLPLLLLHVQPRSIRKKEEYVATQSIAYREAQGVPDLPCGSVMGGWGQG